MAAAAGASCLVLGARPGIGQTLVAAALVHALCAAGLRAVGMKPVARPRAAVAGRWVNAELERLAAVSAFGLPSRALCAAVEAAADPPPGTRPAETTAAVLDTFAALATWADAVVVDADLGPPRGQGAVTDDTLVLAQAMRLPVFLVVSPDEAAAAGLADVLQRMSRRGLAAAGWILNHPQPAGGERARRPSLPACAPPQAGPCLGEIAHEDGASVQRIARRIDPARWFALAERARA